MCPGTLYPHILEKNTNDRGTEKKTNLHLDQQASGRLNSAQQPLNTCLGRV